MSEDELPFFSHFNDDRVARGAGDLREGTPESGIRARANEGPVALSRLNALKIGRGEGDWAF